MSNYIKQLKLNHSITTDLNKRNELNNNYKDEYEYVLDCSNMMDNEKSVFALSDKSIQIRDYNTLQLYLQIQNTHNKRINEIWTSSINSYTIGSCSDDQYVKLWDIRSNDQNPIFQIYGNSEIRSLDCGRNESLLVTGNEDFDIEFYDLRTKKKLFEYNESHNEPITKVRFHPNHLSHLISTSEDGILCIHDCFITDEQESIISIINAETSITNFGFFGQNNENVFFLTGTETLDLWNIYDINRIKQYTNIRELCANENMSIDYLINCIYMKNEEKLFLVGGTDSGIIRIFDLLNLNGSIEPVSILNGGHTGRVRTANWLNGQLLTGGEDSRICSWKCTETNIIEKNKKISLRAEKLKQSRSRPY